jgi:Spy/CpxP family protein refolding chaperone
MKKIILFSAFLIAGLSINAQTVAQAKPEKSTDPVAKATTQTEKMTKELSLNEDQKAKVYVINLNTDKAIELAPADKASLNQKRKAEIMALLTAEQKETFEKMTAAKAVRSEKK